MALNWESVDKAKHEALPKKKTTSGNSQEWEDIMNELQHTNNAIILRYTPHTKERGTLARSVGRRAAHRGFKVDLRDGTDETGPFLSVSRVAEESEPAKKGK